MAERAARVRVIVADDHPFFRDGVSRGLARDGRFDVVGDAADGIAALELIRQERPDVALVDQQMPGLDGLALVRAVHRDGLATRILILSAFTEGSVVFEALQEGAAGYLSKDARRSDIIDAVLKVARGDSVVPESVAGGLVQEIRMRGRSPGPALSERELQVLRGFACGQSIPQVAKDLVIAVSTVKTHTQRLYEKLGVSDRAAAVAEGMRRGLVE